MHRAQWVCESVPLAMQMAEQQTRHAEALRAAEELGYERGLRDARAAMRAPPAGFAPATSA